ncbi:MFS transporter [Labrys portucalensis]|uniref:MFS transporter n=1 Tax=Labrys neptuniae TaxID=376174 RepID=A0ABV6ZAZ8_9HYPH
MANQGYSQGDVAGRDFAIDADIQAVGNAIHRVTAWRIMPLLLACYVFAHLDRINIGFAKLQMTSDLGFSNTAYGLGAGLFFVAYALFGVPSNIMLNKLGPRRGITLIMLVWGILSASTFLISSALQFYGLRFLLGIAEAGFFPGVLVYINRWFPQRRRGQVTALFALAVPAAGLLGGPISGSILESFHDIAGLRGWQWMFLLEGLPVIALALVVYAALPDTVRDASWLSQPQKEHLIAILAAEQKPTANVSLSQCLRDSRVWQLVGIYFAVMLAVNTIAFWTPALINGAGITSDMTIGLLSAIPYLAGCIFMLATGHSSDRFRERRWHLCIPLLMAAGGLGLIGFDPGNPVSAMVGLTIAGMGASTSLPLFWQLPPTVMSAAVLAAGIALVSSLGNVAAFLAPYFLGWMRDATQSSSLALYCLAVLIAIGGLAVLRLPASLVNPR